MPNHTPQISTIVVALMLAFVLGAFARRFRISPLSDDSIARQLGAAGFEAIAGNAADPEGIGNCHDQAARAGNVGGRNLLEGGQVAAQARAINPALPIIARSRSDEETAHLKAHGATRAIMGEEEIGLAMLGTMPELSHGAAGGLAGFMRTKGCHGGQEG